MMQRHWDHSSAPRFPRTCCFRAQRVHAIDPQWRQDVICGAALDEMRWGAVGG